MLGLSTLSTWGIGVTVAVAMLTGAYGSGYNKGRAKEQGIHAVAQAEAVATALSKQSKALADEYTASLDRLQKAKRVEAITTTKKAKSQELSDNSQVLKNPVCVLPKKDNDKLNEILEVLDEEL